MTCDSSVSLRVPRRVPITRVWSGGLLAEWSSIEKSACEAVRKIPRISNCAEAYLRLYRDTERRCTWLSTNTCRPKGASKMQKGAGVGHTGWFEDQHNLRT